MVNYRKIDTTNIRSSIYDIQECLNGGFSYETLQYLLNKKVKLEEVFSVLDKMNLWIEFNYIAVNLISLNQEKVIAKYMNYFIRNNSSILEFKKIIKDIIIDTKLLDDFINNNPDVIIEEITQENIENLKKEKLYDFFKILIEELLSNENKKYSDIEYINEGAYSKAYGIGSKVLKVGESRNTFKIMNNKRFLQPLYRNIIKTSYRDFSIEITEKVDTSCITNEEVYLMYKELREEGILWLDANKNNLGRLLKDNKIYFDGVNYVDKESTGYTTDNFDILPKDSIVLIDVDYLHEADKYFATHDYDIFLRFNPYEARYVNEKNRNKTK